MAETSTGSQNNEETVEITVKTLQKGAFPLKVARDTTVSQLKEKLQPLSEIPATRQRLIFKGRVLRDEQTLPEVGVETGNAVHLVERPADAPPTGQPDPASAGAQGPIPPPPGGGNANPPSVQEFSRFLTGVLSQIAGGAATMPGVPPMPGVAPMPGAAPAARGQQPQSQESMHLLVALHTFLQTLEGETHPLPPIPITSLHPRSQDGSTQQYRWLTAALQRVLNPSLLSPEVRDVLRRAVRELDATAPSAQQPSGTAGTGGNAAPAATAAPGSAGPAPTPATLTPAASAQPAAPGAAPTNGPRASLRRPQAAPYPYVQLVIPAIVGLVQRTHDYMSGPLARNLARDVGFLREVQPEEGNRTEVAGRIRELTGRLHAAAALFTELARACAAACLATEGNAAALAFNTAAVLNADGTQPSFPRLLPRSDAPHIADAFIVRGEVDPSQMPTGMPPFPGMFMPMPNMPDMPNMPNIPSPGGTSGPTPTPADGSGAQTPAGGTGPIPPMPDMGQAGGATATARFGPFVTPGGTAFGGFSIQGEGPMDIGQQLMSMFSHIPGAQVVQGPTTTTIAVTSTQFPGEDDDLPQPPPPPTGSVPGAPGVPPAGVPAPDMPDLSNLPDIPFPDMHAIRIDMADVTLPRIFQQVQGMMGPNFMQPPPQQPGQAQQPPPAGGANTGSTRSAGPQSRPDMSSVLQALSPVVQNIVQNVVSNIVQASSTPAATSTTPAASTADADAARSGTSGSTPAGAPDQPELRSAVVDAVSAGLEAVLSTISSNLTNIEHGLRQVEQRTGENADFMEVMRQLSSVLVNSFPTQETTSTTPAAPASGASPTPASATAPTATTTTTTTTSTPAPTDATPNDTTGTNSQPTASSAAHKEGTATDTGAGAGAGAGAGTSGQTASAPSMPPRGLGGGLRATSAKRKAVSAASKSAAAKEAAAAAAASDITDITVSGVESRGADAATAGPQDWSELMQVAEVMRSAGGGASTAPAATATTPPAPTPATGAPGDSLAAMMGGLGGLGGLASQLTQSSGSGGGGGGLGNLFQMAGRIAADPTMRPMIEQAASELFGGGSSGGGGLGNLLGSLLGGGGAGPRPSQSRAYSQPAPSWDVLSGLGSATAEEWRNIIEHDETEQLLMSEQPEFSDTYLAGAPPRSRSLFKRNDALPQE